jgi:PKD repeat protein
MSRARTAVMLVMALVASTFTFWPSAAHAVQASQPNVVSAVPQTNTPDVNDGTVYSIGQVGNQVILGGDFTSVSPHGQPGTTFTRNNILAFNPTSGVIDTGFVPTVNGEVDSIIPGPAAGQVYIAGSFTTVDGVAMRVALLNTSNGSLVSTWKPASISGATTKLVLANGMLFVGGSFTAAGGAQHGGLVALNPTTGKALTYVNLAFTGNHNFGVNCTGTGCADGAVGIKSFDIDPSGQHLIAIGNFTSAGPQGGPGLPRDQVAMIDLGTTSATIDPNWATAAYTAACFTNAFDSYIRDVQFSPDGSYFVIAATGGSGTNTDGTNSSCDTAARYATTDTGSNVRPTWIDYTGQDSFWTVAVTGTAVYLGGHERWVNNSKGFDFAGPGAVPRPGIVALSVTSGLPLAWNPGRSPRGGGARALLATSTGLWVGSDTDYIGNRQFLHKKVAFFPLAGGETLASDATPTLPGRVYTAGAFATPGSTNVLYRINTGGPTIPAADNGPDWQADQNDPSSLRNSGSNAAGYGPVDKVDTTVPASTPSSIFSSERWDPGSNGDGNEMHWAFPVPAGEKVDVRLYFANRCTCTSGVGQRVFDVAVDGTTLLDHFDIVKAAGDQTGTMRDAVVTSDGQVTVDLSHEVENPAIDGIEIVKQSAPTSFPAALYRVNSGGGEIDATDGSPANWLADNSDTVGTGTPVRSGGNIAGWADPWDGARDASLPPSAPSELFSSERWAPQSYTFPVDPGTPLTVRLFFANNCDCTAGAGQRAFNVDIDGNSVMSNYDIVADVGNKVGEMKSFDVTAPASGQVTVNLTNGSNDNAVINGVEVDQTAATPVQPPGTTNVDRFSYRHFDGTTTGPSTSLNTGISWGSIRGAFTVNGEIVYGRPDGFLYERSFNGSTFGSEVKLDPYHDPFWDNIDTGSGQTYTGQMSDFANEIPSLTSMFFTNGRLYYTLAGDSTMHWRWFEPDSGTVGSDEFQVADGMDWSHVAGAFLSGNTLYFADKASGSLSSVGWDGTKATGSPSVANTSTDWASRGIFMLADATNPNQSPNANFTATCSATNNACTIDASGSIDPDGSITDFAFSYGDGSTTDHRPNNTVFSHDFGAPGNYTVSLTVMDNDGATNTETKHVVVGQVTPVPTFKGATATCGDPAASPALACGKSATTKAPVPTQVAAGDALLMFASWANTANTISVPAGWHLLAKDVSSPLESDVFYRSATASDVGGSVPVTFNAAVKNSVTLADYSGADVSSIESFAKSADSATASHTTPTAPVTVDGSLAVSYWTDRSGTTSSWTLPAGVQGDSNSFDNTGTTFVTSVLGHSTSLVNTSAGTYGGKTATTNAPSGKGAEWTILLAPSGSTANQSPTAAFTSNCGGLSCAFDSTGTNDPDGSISSYSWNFGDGTPLGTTANPSHSYVNPGTYHVTLTVTDNGSATGSVTHDVTVSAAASAIGFGGSDHADGVATSQTVHVPAGAGTGDALLLFESYGTPTVTTTTPSGWTLVGTATKSNLVTNVYSKVATATDHGTAVTPTFSASVHASLTLADYTHAALPVEANGSASAASTTTHTAPGLTGLSAGSWVLSWYSDRTTTTATASWTGPAAETQRSTVLGTGANAVSAMLADSAGPVSGAYPAQTANTDATSGAAVQWSVALSPTG